MIGAIGNPDRGGSDSGATREGANASVILPCVPNGTESPSRPPPIDWNAIVDRAIAGDRAAYARLTRLVTGYLAQWRAYDFRPDWDDMVQDVLVSTVGAYREGRLDAPGALAAYVRQATRFKFIDRIRANKRRADGKDPEAAFEQGAADPTWPPLGDPSGSASGALSPESKATLAQAVEQLPERERLSVYEVHVRGRTYEEAARETGIPLGSLKRALRSGLASLREVMTDERR